MDHDGRGASSSTRPPSGPSAIRREDAVGREMAELIVPPDLRERHRARPAPLPRDRRGAAARPADRDRGDARRRHALPGRADDHPDRRPRRPRLHRPPARHHRPACAAERELRASRARLVEAADAARRRIERDLHDGAQQQLVSVAMTLRVGAARLLDGRSRRGGRELLDEAQRRPAAGDRRAARARPRDPPRGADRGRAATRRCAASSRRSAVPAEIVAVPDGAVPARRSRRPRTSSSPRR